MRDRIDPVEVPFSDRGSRLLLYKHHDRPAFYLKLAERLENIEPGLEAHRDRPPFLTDIILLDGDGRRLDFSFETYPHVIRCHSPIGRFDITFSDHDTLAIGLPHGKSAGVSLVITDLFETPDAKPGDPINSRRVVLRSNLKVKHDDRVTMQNGHKKTMIVEAGESGSILIGILRGHNTGQNPRGFPLILEAAESRWETWFRSVPTVKSELAPSYVYAWWTLANNLVAPLGSVQFEAVMPSKAQYWGIWNWDACFHAVGLRHQDPELARNQLRTILAKQCDDGMIPDVVHDEGVVDKIDHPIKARVTKPPVAAWAALKIQASDPNTQFLREIYPALKRWNQWWREQSSQKGEQLSYYEHPYSSGLDDNPLWDHGFPVVAPDLNTYLVIQMEALANIAATLGLGSEAHAWKLAADKLARRMVAELYDRKRGFFWAVSDRSPIIERTPFNLYPLWSGRMSATVEKKLVEHLTNPDLFWGPYPLSTVARSSVKYSPTTMWRGPVWININYIFIEALERVGRVELSQEIRKRTLELVVRNPGIYEYYNPEDGSVPRSAAPIFSWSAALFIDLCLQEEQVVPAA
jgi:hypothetical protein